jgi:hypothetical protein
VDEDSKNIKNILKIFTNTNIWLLHRLEISKKSLLEFEKEVEVHFIPMMTIFLSSIGMKHHKHWELIGWFCCWRNLAVSWDE